MSLIAYNKYNCLLGNIKDPVYKIPNHAIFTLDQYIKSQLHFPFVANKEGRSVLEFLGAYKIISSNDLTNEKNLRDFSKVLNYFYTDISSVIESSKKEDGFDFELSSNCVTGFSVEVFNAETSKDAWVKKVEKLKDLAISGEPVLIEMR